ncbi:hypothetical protein [Bailinhaonella thermotolerans]|uniref:hypothetical protein n=1 Tax=Bailinhaonella thermotolerans TaxID=1070861 RepID=UPI00192A6ADE|nr:hypothetical protein [Bailinhaonella thermotolerans]
MMEPLHFLTGLRCPTCGTLNASWLDPAACLVECGECGQTSHALIEMNGGEAQ